jgi:uncharacterized RDD family membrane protein YckC
MHNLIRRKKIAAFSRSGIVEIESPEQIRIPYMIASPFTRLLALIVDVCILYMSLAVLVILLIFLNILHLSGGLTGTFRNLRNIAGSSALSGISVFFIMLLDFIMQWGYFIFFEVIMNGRTPGKVIFGLRVINYNGKPLDIISIILRNFIRIFDQQYSFYLGAFFCIILNKDFRRIGDLAAGTIVINEERENFRFPEFSVLKGAKWPEQKFLVKKLSEEDLYIIRNFLNSLDTLTIEKQHMLSDKLAEKIKDKLQDNEEYTDSLLYLQKIYESHKEMG